MMLGRCDTAAQGIGGPAGVMQTSRLAASWLRLTRCAAAFHANRPAVPLRRGVYVPVAGLTLTRIVLIARAPPLVPAGDLVHLRSGASAFVLSGGFPAQGSLLRSGLVATCGHLVSGVDDALPGSNGDAVRRPAAAGAPASSRGTSNGSIRIRSVGYFVASAPGGGADPTCQIRGPK